MKADEDQRQEEQAIAGERSRQPEPNGRAEIEPCCRMMDDMGGPPPAQAMRQAMMPVIDECAREKEEGRPHARGGAGR